MGTFCKVSLPSFFSKKEGAYFLFKESRSEVDDNGLMLDGGEEFLQNIGGFDL